jgi:hypothetical protein
VKYWDDLAAKESAAVPAPLPLLSDTDGAVPAGSAAGGGPRVCPYSGQVIQSSAAGDSDGSDGEMGSIKCPF